MPKQSIPDTVQWLLDFLNVNSVQGEIKSWRIPVKEIQAPCLSKFKRPPAKPTEDRGESAYCDEMGYRWVDYRGDPFLLGKGELLPGLNTFKELLLRKGLPPFKPFKDTEYLYYLGKDTRTGELIDVALQLNKNYVKTPLEPIEKEVETGIRGMWNVLSLYCVSRVWRHEWRDYGNFVNCFGYFYDLYRKIISVKDEITPNDLKTVLSGKLLGHNGFITLAICSYVVDLFVNHGEILETLKQCHRCGAFHLNEKNQKFCSDVCRKAFHLPSSELKKEQER